ncbi:GH24 family phage-related lysozyme (muramidase) [Bartonella heixiaziensis]
MRKISKEGLELIKQWEGLRLEAYRDTACVWTIGYGHTSKAGNSPCEKRDVYHTRASGRNSL